MRKGRLAHGKVNLGLAVTGRRADGYHELRSVFLRIGIHDLLAESLEPPGAGDSLAVVGDPNCPVQGNTVLRALRLLRDAMPGGHDLPPVALELHKEIPIAAGLGGGSSDGAAALLLAPFIWGRHLSEHELMRLAASLGADVPFFAADHAIALVSGVGDRMEPVRGVSAKLGLLLVNPPEPLATAAVFAEFDRLGAPPSSARHAIDEFQASLEAGVSARVLSGRVHRLRDANDLWPAAVNLLPRLECLRAELERTLDVPFLLSGSGSTLFALYPSPGRAREEAFKLVSSKAQELDGARVFVTGIEIDADQNAWRIQ